VRPGAAVAARMAALQVTLAWKGSVRAGAAVAARMAALQVEAPPGGGPGEKTERLPFRYNGVGRDAPGYLVEQGEPLGKGETGNELR
jgi:hypothetical protein